MFAVGPTFVQNDTMKNVMINDNITLDCSILESNPLATVTNSTTATTTTNVLFNSTTNMITISSIVIGNSGVYTCTANSGQNIATLRYTLNVEEGY